MSRREVPLRLQAFGQFNHVLIYLSVYPSLVLGNLWSGVHTYVPTRLQHLHVGYWTLMPVRPYRLCTNPVLSIMRGESNRSAHG